jgi:cob(I)alamin adenosyltransferase
MKIYTKSGDNGTTSLLGGQRVPKFDLRIEAYGTIDEFNSFVGVLHDMIEDLEIKKQLIVIQNKLFNIGSILACSNEDNFKLPQILTEDVEMVERNIDEMNEVLPELKNFILPSGHIIVSHCHLCRTICRRAERRVVELSENAPSSNLIIIYLNRLSDYFFVLSRYLGKNMGISETIWNS